jgi:beta-aspartyl-dipeptidase (metallo-type)
MDLARGGSTIDITAFPVAEDQEDELAASEALTLLLESDVPWERVTVSSDGGGCLPTFDENGRVSSMDVGDPGALVDCVRDLLAAGGPLERILPPFTSNVADLLRLSGKGRIEVGGDADGT